MQNTTLIVKQATSCYQQGDYKNALSFYQQAADKYGSQLFKGNIQLCNKKLNGTPLSLSSPLLANSPLTLNTGDSQVAKQLQQTQQLLEHYYTRTQELEYQLLDSK